MNLKKARRLIQKGQIEKGIRELKRNKCFHCEKAPVLSEWIELDKTLVPNGIQCEKCAEL